MAIGAALQARPGRGVTRREPMRERMIFLAAVLRFGQGRTIDAHGVGAAMVEGLVRRPTRNSYKGET
jgi:hypothetical protein